MTSDVEVREEGYTNVYVNGMLRVSVGEDQILLYDEDDPEPVGRTDL